MLDTWKLELLYWYGALWSLFLVLVFCYIGDQLAKIRKNLEFNFDEFRTIQNEQLKAQVATYRVLQALTKEGSR